MCIIVFGIFQKPQEEPNINLQNAEVLPTDVGDRYAFPVPEPSEEEAAADLMPPEIPQAPRQQIIQSTKFTGQPHSPVTVTIGDLWQCGASSVWIDHSGCRSACKDFHQRAVCP